MDHQVSPEPENGQSEEEEEDEETSDLENGPKAKLSSSPPKLFTFSMVNSYGTANISPLPCDGNVLKLNRKLEGFFLGHRGVNWESQGIAATIPWFQGEKK